MARAIHIHKALVLFPADTGDLSRPHIVKPGHYSLEKVSNPVTKDGAPWWKIVGQPWANVQECWQAVSVETDMFKGKRSWWFRWSGTGLAASCLALLLLKGGDAGAPGKKTEDLPALRLELVGLANQLENLTNHYPLIITPVQIQYRKRYEDAVYSLNIYPLYRAVRQAQQQQVLQKQPNLENYAATMQAIDEELYHAWHDWKVPHQPALIASIQKKKERLLSTGIMNRDRDAYCALQPSTFTQANAPAALQFNERIEQEIVDMDPALTTVARQNRDCAERSIQLFLKINSVAEQVAKLEAKVKKSPKSPLEEKSSLAQRW